MTDRQLLQDYLSGSQTAFAELVRRHADWVYSVARRRLRDPHLAEDVAQAVFVVLARKGHRLQEETVLAAWLFQVTRLTVWRMQRDQSRQRRRERNAAILRSAERGTTESDHDAVWRDLEPVLDESVARLRDSDRKAVLLRFYQRKSFSEVAALIGATEDAARKRVSRAVDRLRAMLQSRGALVPSTILAALLLDRAAQPAPAAVASSAGPIASEHARLAVGQLAQGAMLMLAWQKARIAVLVMVVVLLSGIAGISVLREPRAEAQTEPKPPTTAPADPNKLAVVQATPILKVNDIEASLDFYTNRLGFEKLWAWGEPPTFAAVARDGMRIYLAAGDMGHAGTWIYLTVTDVDALFQEISDRGLDGVEPPVDHPWGMREILVADPDGHRIRIGSIVDKSHLPVRRN
jgi:RNA polymerase sigma factor (sigma-70 family)